ncbi:adenosine deaminase family protein [Occallatibacter riparius]|uniref:adenosine deaminase n=1 Tax=Occallatibacter riparius TaxID=1002689 RepID=A0A9J7BQ13_9BACT|nr:adenosine deaminase [Occallatibacter riparius]UWZ84875.1 adenosine deaminase [Occallatibacter riparius]
MARSADEARAERAYDEALKAGPLTLRAFLVKFPKGADLHVHLSGAVYAETFIRDAGEDKLCVDPEGKKWARDGQGNLLKEPCPGQLVAASVLTGHSLKSADQDLYDALVNSFSMRSFVPYAGFSGHDQFFATFGKFGGIDKRHTGEWVDEVASRAAEQNQQYLELMQTPVFSHATMIAKGIGWPEGQVDFAQLRQKLLDGGLRDEVAPDMEDVRSSEEQRKQIEHCGTAEEAPACEVEVRYIYQILRASPPEIVFAQTLLGFETIQKSMDTGADGFVGINFVQPEDGFVSMRDYALQMKMVGYLHSVYPKVHISLHAGELVPGVVTPEGLRFHVREAVETAHAERIGHGVDVMYETDAAKLLKAMAEKHVMVEINLSSNEGILGVKGEDHPLPLYIKAHVPVALSTDDEGVSRIDLTNEYVKAAMEYHPSYQQLKMFARTGMEHDFLPGDSLWAEGDDFRAARGACRGQLLGGDNPSGGCKSLIEKSQKATAQWELERRFRAFEAAF